MNIPMARPGAAYPRLQAELDAAWRRVMHSGRYVLGPEVAAFETEFADQFGLGEAVGVASGTEALWLALRAAGIGPGDDVIVPALTASATVASIVETGAYPVFADVREGDLNLDPDDLPGKLTERTRAVVAVHLYGNPARAVAIAAFCRAHGLLLIEDCAQAHGARLVGQSVGTFGDVAAWSFYPTKNLGAFGDAGLVSTRRPELAEAVRQLREYGWRERYHSQRHGWNSRLDELQAALLRVRLQRLEADNERRRAIARTYRAAAPDLCSPRAEASALGVEHLFVVRHPQRAALRLALEQAGVGTAIHYPVPCHLQVAYRQFGHGEGSLPIAERAAREVLSLPLYPELAESEVEYVAQALITALAGLP